jgi:flavin reductase (DIM6/NTAB) family NADH-FMN oxidoreductase RutF
MGKRQFKPGNMLYPVPAVLVTVADREGNSNIFTVAWAGTICTNPPMLSISVRPERHSYHMMKETGEFVVNLTTESMAWATDYCGVRSGRDVDKWKETGLTPEKANVVDVPVIKESPVNIECRVVKVEELGSHHMFIADVVAVDVDEAYMDEKDTFHLSMAKPLAYSHGRYYGMGEELGSFGYSVRKQEKGAKAGRKTSKSAEKGAKAGRKTSKSAEKAGGAGKVRKSADVNGGKKATTRPEQTRKANSQKSDGPRNDKKRQK